MILKRLDRIVQGIDIDNHRGHRTGFGEFISRGICLLYTSDAADE